MNTSLDLARGARADSPDSETSVAAQTAACSLKIATYNIHGSHGRWTAHSVQRKLAQVARVIAEIDADVVALQEVPLGGSETPDLLAHLRDTTGMYAVEGPTLDTSRRRYGNAVLSRLPVRATRVLDLSLHRREPRGALDADIECGSTLLRVVATHLGLSARERNLQVRLLLAAFDTSSLPVILLGDINEWFLHGRALRTLVTHFRRAPAPRTFPTVCPVFALDRIWVHPGEWLGRVAVHRSAAARGASDHYPLVAHIEVPGEVQGRHARGGSDENQ